MDMSTTLTGALLAAAMLTAAPATRAADSAPPVVTSPAGPAQAVVTHHAGTFNGRRVAYDAIVEPFVVADAKGQPGARLVTMAYVATDAGDAAKRPVMFVFNGGPISPSDILHMGAFGPKRVAIPDDLAADPASFKTVDNGYTVLDVADIVFFDPASTGLSRVLPGVDPKSYFSVTADGQQTAQLIVEWCKAHGRTGAPKYVLGESYGTLRAASVANQLQKLPTPIPLNGVILLGQALNIIEFSQRPTNVTSYVVSLPTLAAIAWSHGRVDRKDMSFERFEDEVMHFSRTDYLEALILGSSLDEPTRQRIAARLQAYSGIPASFYLFNDLRITKERFRRELLKDRGLTLGQNDARYAGTSSDPSSIVPQAYERAFRAYLGDDLAVKDVGAYVVQSPVAGLEGWRWGGGSSPFSDWPYPALLTEVFAADPKFRVMVGNGWQDTQTTAGAAKLVVDQSGWPRDRTSLHFYQGGHMAYSVEDSLRRITDDVRAFVTAR